MKSIIRLATVLFATLFAVSLLSAQQAKLPQRRPAFTKVTPANPPQPNYDFFSILDGQPRGFSVHHDTVADTGAPIDVYVFAIEMQVMNSDGDFEPEGLIINNYFTAKPVEPHQAINPHNARDCGIWNSLITNEMKHDPAGFTWSYVEFNVALNARTVTTNEDGAVWWSDDIECWGSRDRFAPF